MQTYTVEFAPEAQEQLVELYHYIARQGAGANAADYTEAIVAYCESMHISPHRGMRRDDIRPGLRITNYAGTAVIAFAVNDAQLKVSVIGVYYGGQDYAASLVKPI